MNRAPAATSESASDRFRNQILAKHLEAVAWEYTVKCVQCSFRPPSDLKFDKVALKLHHGTFLCAFAVLNASLHLDLSEVLVGKASCVLNILSTLTSTSGNCLQPRALQPFTSPMHVTARAGVPEA